MPGDDSPLTFNGSLTFTPMNSFLYNLDPKNLALHGIHNRLTHLVVNFPIMVGPLVIILFLEVIQVGTALFSTNSHHHTHHHHHHHHHKSNSNQNQSNAVADILPLKTRALLLSVIVFGLFLLSMAPHQEARFLLPFSLTHSVLHSQAQQPQDLPVSVIYFKTYMPPEHLMTIPLNSTRSISVIDPRGDLDSLTQIMSTLHNSEILILSSQKKILYQQYKGKTCQLIESFWPHLSTENPPDTIDEMRLYLFSCHDWSE
ncbi:hypothetical protein PPL_03820 [Heterostelium album PN500]|uniref:Mannosyltransferase n=1 Tax=Heterostelium pallidum (strain ATCC 26659 / Pp 5 / PN500) TaxID=670386 RepID=D3B6R5_HETP5|nr:hypothetical protein PPL_03820 [Heterostelium album PN500]EFA83035.1 hypothetical protein PPL_03820 [Heterostelium album PN500]|eukprot:XP_020435152.1 hypothetical protein PPL_03820 [Heterostelium album PN500]